jgi:hypothetical protein
MQVYKSRYLLYKTKSGRWEKHSNCGLQIPDSPLEDLRTS